MSTLPHGIFWSDLVRNSYGTSYDMFSVMYGRFSEKMLDKREKVSYHGSRRIFRKFKGFRM